MTTEQTEATTILRLTHTFPAPRERLFRAWTDPALLARWWWPAHFATTYAIDLRPGGQYSIRSADLPGRGVLAIGGTFLEVRAPERLVYTWRWEGLDEAETRVTVEFRARSERTEIILTHERFVDATERDNNRLGWESCLDRLAQELAADTPLAAPAR